MKHSKVVNNSKGQSLFEVILAIGIIGLVIASIAALAAISIRNTTFSRNNTQATAYAQEAVEWLRGQRDSDWTSFYTNVSSAGGVYCLDTLSWANPTACVKEPISGTILERQVSFSGITPTQVTANITVSWNDAQGFHQAETSTVFTDWRFR